jgi:GMP synthase-like glutamine amidotransferase
MKIHCLQHVAFETPGYIAEWLEKNGHSLSLIQFFNSGFQLPDIEDVHALIIMGGPMSVYDEHLYPWLQSEKAFIEDCIQAGKKVLGICLGAQLIAVCLGATVFTAKNKEIGWFPVSLTEDAAKQEPFCSLFQNEPTVFHWHGEKFEIPYDGSCNLLDSAANSNQFLFHSPQVLGLQFHLEVTETLLAQMIENGMEELRPQEFIQTPEQLLDGKKHLEKCNRLMGAVLRYWLEV